MSTPTFEAHTNHTRFDQSRNTALIGWEEICGRSQLCVLPDEQNHYGVDGDNGDPKQHSGDEHQNIVASVRHQNVRRHVLTKRQVPINPCSRQNVLPWCYHGVTVVNRKCFVTQQTMLCGAVFQ